MTEHLVTRDGQWSAGRVGLPQRPEPVRETAPSPLPVGQPQPPLREWTRSERGWSPTSWRRGEG